MALCFSLATPLFAGGKRGGAPPPNLMAPTDNTDLSGRDALTFRWSSESGASTDHYDFRLYEGPQTVESGLIKQEQLPGGATSLDIPASTFQEGHTYAWSMRRIGSIKSRPVFSVFKVVKK